MRQCMTLYRLHKCLALSYEWNAEVDLQADPPHTSTEQECCLLNGDRLTCKTSHLVSVLPTQGQWGPQLVNQAYVNEITPCCVTPETNPGPSDHISATLPSKIALCQKPFKLDAVRPCRPQRSLLAARSLRSNTAFRYLITLLTAGGSLLQSVLADWKGLTDLLPYSYTSYQLLLLFWLK